MPGQESQSSNWSELVDLAAERFADISRQAITGLYDILDAGRSIVGCAEAGLLIPDEAPNRLKFLVSVNTSPEISRIVTQTSVPTDGSLVGLVFNTGQLMAVANPESFYAEVDQKTGLKTVVYMAIPIMDADGDALGVATFLNRPEGQEQDPFDQTEIESGMRIADLIASGLRYYQRIVLQQALFQCELTAVAERFVENISFPDSMQTSHVRVDQEMPLVNAIHNLERLPLHDLELAEELLGVLVARRTSMESEF
ncbi:MAG: GAF domain-containing protein [Pirellulaceae bacterium]